MPKATNIEFRVGVIVLLGIIILLGSLYWLQDYRVKRDARSATVKFESVGTLAVGDKVTVSGVRKGKVNDLQLVDGGVLVELLVYRDVNLKRDATFTIRNYGLMGERFIDISPGRDSLPYQWEQTAVGRYDPGIPEVMGLLGEMTVELRQVVVALRKSVASDESLDKFNRMVSNMEQVSASLRDYMERNESKLDETANNFLAASRNVKKMLQRNEGLVDSSLTRIDRATVKLEAFTCQLDTLAQSARHFADMLENGDGTVQAMLEDRRLYDDLRKAADNLDDLVSDIRENPRRYINLKFELF